MAISAVNLYRSCPSCGTSLPPGSDGAYCALCGPPDMPAGPFRVIYADPPWQYDSPQSVRPQSRIEVHYPTMRLEEICALHVPCSRDAVLFLWVPSPLLEKGLLVLNAWRFCYRTSIVWDKQRTGLAHYIRPQHELLLIGIRGRPGTPAPKNRPSSILRWPRGRHSAKPEIIYTMIERMYPGPYLELFARPPFREGWSHWGDETYANSEQRFLFEPGNELSQLVENE